MNEDLLSLLEPHYDAQYAAFHARLVPMTRYEVHGVRIPVIRKLAKAMSDLNDLDARLEAQRAAFARKQPTFEEVMLHLLAIAYRKDTPDAMIARAKPSFGLIDNWAHCDTFSATFAKNLLRHASGAAKIQSCILSNDPWETRIGLVMALSLKDDARAEISVFLSKHADKIDDSHVQVSMGIAWLLSQVIATHPSQTLALLNAWPFSAETLKRTHQKIRESRRAGLKEAL